MFCRQSPVHTQPKLPSWQHFLLRTLEPSQCGIIPTFNTTTEHTGDKIQKLFISISFHANKKFWDGAPKRLSLAQRSYNVDGRCPHTFHRRRKYSTLQWDYKRRWKLRGFRNRRIARTEPASPIIALNCQSLRYCSLWVELLDSSKFSWISLGCNLNFSKQNQG